MATFPVVELPSQLQSTAKRASKEFSEQEVSTEVRKGNCLPIILPVGPTRLRQMQTFSELRRAGYLQPLDELRAYQRSNRHRAGGLTEYITGRASAEAGDEASDLLLVATGSILVSHNPVAAPSILVVAYRGSAVVVQL